MISVVVADDQAVVRDGLILLLSASDEINVVGAAADGPEAVTLIEQTHNLPTMERVRGGGRLTDPESYEERTLGVFPCTGY